MSRRTVSIGGILVTTLAGFLGLEAQEPPPREIRINIEGKGFTRIKIALPDPAAGSESRSAAEELIATVRADLAFSGFFDVVDPTLYAKIPPQPEGTVAHDDWLGIGADAVVFTQLSLRGDRLDLAARLYDNPSKKMTFHRRYGGGADIVRRVAHQLSDDLVQHYTGSPGVAMTRIAFVSKHGKGKEIYLMDYDGQRIRRLTTTGTLNLFPVWSPDGNRLAFISWIGRQPGIRIMDSDGRLTAVPALRGELNSTPDWSPDGKKIVFSSDMDGNSDLYLLTVSTGQVARLTFNPAIDTSPVFSPNGREIAFTSDRSGTPQIYVTGVDGLNARRISPEGTYNDSPAWSPRGDRIAYAARVERHFQIVLLDLATNSASQITRGSADSEDPRWSPDGRHIVFSSNREGASYDIWVMAADGSDPRRLTRGGDSFTPDWSR